MAKNRFVITGKLEQHPLAEVVTVPFDSVIEGLKWMVSKARQGARLEPAIQIETEEGWSPIVDSQIITRKVILEAIKDCGDADVMLYIKFDLKSMVENLPIWGFTRLYEAAIDIIEQDIHDIREAAEQKRLNAIPVDETNDEDKDLTEDEDAFEEGGEGG